MSECSGENVVIFKSVSESENQEQDVYKKKFLSAGYNVTLVPVLDFEFVNLEQLRSKILRPDDYAGVIFSSPRCVKGFELSIEEGDGKSILEKWKNHMNFVVGEATGKLADKLGLFVSGQEAGNGNALAEIISRDSYEKPFLYPIGSLTQKNFKIKLKENNIDVDEVLIYKTKPHHELEENILKVKIALNKNSAYFIYFSPSGVNFTLPLLKKHEVNLETVKFVAIGPVTEVALQDAGFHVAKTSQKPNPENLLEALLSLNS